MENTFILYLGKFDFDGQFIHIITSNILDNHIIKIFKSDKAVEQLYVEAIDDLITEYDVSTIYVSNTNVYNLFLFDGLMYKMSKFKKVDHLLLESVRSKIESRSINVYKNDIITRKIKDLIRNLCKV